MNAPETPADFILPTMLVEQQHHADIEAIAGSGMVRESLRVNQVGYNTFNYRWKKGGVALALRDRIVNGFEVETSPDVPWDVVTIGILKAKDAVLRERVQRG